MPIEIEGPDGTIIEFPDGTDNATITGVMRKQYGGPQEVSTAEDVGKSAVSGLARGAAEFAMLPVTAARFAQRQLDRAGEAIGLVTPETRAAMEQYSPVSTALAAGQDSARQAMDATLHKPETTAGEYARTAGEFAPGLLGGGGSLLGRVMTNVVAPAVASETAGQLTEGTDLEPWARALGGVAGGVGAWAGARAITPAPSSAAREGMVEALAREGVDVTAGQRTGSNALRNAESELGGGKIADFMERQGDQFTGAVLQRVGVQASRATPEVIDGAFNTIGQKFDDLAARNQLVPDAGFGQQLSKALKEYNDLVPETARAPAVQGLVDDIVQAVGNAANQGRGLPGEVYQAYRSRLDRLARGARADPQLQDAFNGIRAALDDGMERSLARTNPQDVGMWREARREWRNLLVVEKAATRAGEQAAEGVISPASLRQAVVQQNRRSYARGSGDFAELARAGNAIMTPLPNSGTAARTAARNLGTSTLAALGAATGSQVGGVQGAIAGGIAGTALPYVAGRGMLSELGQAYLGNQVLQTQFNPLSLESLSRGLVTLPTTSRERR